MPDNTYLIKDITRLSGLSINTVKYYLRIGLIKETGRSPETNFRYFNDATIDTLNQIRSYRRNNLSLRKIKELIDQRK